MSDWKKKAHTPEIDAVDVYGTYPDNAERRIAHVDCLRSQVFPRDELIEELVAALDNARDELTSAYRYVPEVGQKLIRSALNEIDPLLTKAHSHGYGNPPES